ncbi:membrane hypothetical protein [Gammaproteobacteria bacterium]
MVANLEVESTQSQHAPRIFHAAIKFLYFSFFVWFCAIGPMRPFANYDMLLYAGAVLDMSGQKDNLRTRSLAEVKKYVSAEQYSHFIGGSYFRETVAKDDRAFIEQLPAYLVKPLYVLLTGLLGVILDNIALASVLISAAGFFMMGGALYLLRPPDIYEPFWLVATMGVLYLGHPSLTLLTRVATPDSLATGLILMGFWAYLRKPQSVLPIILISLSILARPDSIITTVCLFPLFAKFFIKGITRVEWLFGSVMTPILIYSLGKTFFPGLGFAELIIYAIKGPFPYFSSMETSQFIGIYSQALQNDFLSLITLPRIDIFLIASLALLVFSKNHYAKLIVLAALGNLVVKVILFPNFDVGYQERYFFISYFLLLFAAFNGQENPHFLRDKFKPCNPG